MHSPQGVWCCGAVVLWGCGAVGLQPLAVRGLQIVVGSSWLSVKNGIAKQVFGYRNPIFACSARSLFVA